MGSLESDDHGETSDSSVNSVGDLQAVEETVEGTAQVKILISLLPEESITEDSHGNGLVSSFSVRLVDFDFLF